MERMTEKELELMKLLWVNGSSFVRDLVELYPEPKPHFNTLSTYVRLLEKKGLVGHESFGGSFKYFPTVTREDYSIGLIQEVADDFYDGSLKSIIVALVERL